MGLLEDGSHVVPRLDGTQFAGPGEAYVGYGEYNQRHLLSRWADHLEKPPADVAQVEVGGQVTG
jgi:hypothetical protein